VRFILDHNLAPNLARAVDLLVDDEVTCLKDRGWQASEDEEWISAVGREGDWVIVTGDLNIVRNAYRQKVFREANVTTFFLLEAWSKGTARGTEIAQRLLKLWPEIASRAARAPRGTCFAVPYRGAIHRFSPQGKRPI
jgi:hypothetical protein